MDELTSAQLSEWEAYDRLDPIGTWRDDFRMAYIVSVMTNLVIGVHGKKGAQLTSLQQFMPNWDFTAPKEVKKMSVEEMKQILLGIAHSQNKKFSTQSDKQSKIRR